MKLRLLVFFISCAIPFVSLGQKDSLPEFHSSDKSLFKKGNTTLSSEYIRRINFSGELMPFVLVMDDGSKKVGVVNKHGKVVISPIYKRIFKIEEGFFAVKLDEGSYEFYDKARGFINPVGCDSFRVNNGLILWGRNLKWGALLKKGKGFKVIPALYKDLELSENKIKVRNFNKWIFRKEETILNSVFYDSIYFLSDTIFVFERAGMKGVAGLSGEEILPAMYSSIEVRKDIKDNISSNTKKIVVGNFYGGDKDGELILLNEKNYKRNNSLSEPVWSSNIDGDSSLKRAVSSNLFLLKQKGLYGLIDKQAKEILPCKYDLIRGPYKEGIFIVYENKQAAIIDTNGVFLHEPGIRADSIFDFKEGRARIIKSGKYGFIDKRGNVRVAPIYKEAREFNEGAAAVLLNGNWGFIDGDENIIVQPLYTEVMDLRNGLARCRVGKDWMLVSKQGEKVSLNYDKIWEDSAGKWISAKSGKLGLVDASGRELLAPRYEEVNDLGNNKVIVKKGGKWGVVDYGENFIIPIEYDYVICNKQKSLFAVMMKGNEEQIEVINGK